MADYDNTNRGALFKNDRKEKETQPDYKGKINVEGQDFWLSAWLQTGKSGVKFMALSVQPKEQESGYQKAKQAREQLQTDIVHEVLDEQPINLNDIPF